MIKRVLSFIVTAGNQNVESQPASKKKKKKRDHSDTDTDTRKSKKHSSCTMDSVTSDKHKKRKVTESTDVEEETGRKSKEEITSKSKRSKEKKRKKSDKSVPLEIPQDFRTQDSGSSSSSKQKKKKAIDKMDTPGDTGTKSALDKKSENEKTKQKMKSPKKSKVDSQVTENKKKPDKGASSEASHSNNLGDSTKRSKVSNPAGDIQKRLLEISQTSSQGRTSSDHQNSNTKLKRKLGKAKGHIRFGSSDDESSSSDSSSESSSESSTAEQDSKKTGEKTLAAAPHKETDAKHDDALGLKTKSGLEHTSESKGAGAGDAMDSLHDQSRNQTTDVTMATENGFEADDGKMPGPRIRNANPGRKQRNWNPLSKQAQLNSQLSNKSMIIQVSYNSKYVMRSSKMSLNSKIKIELTVVSQALYSSRIN